MTDKDFLSIFQMAENFCGRHQIVYCDHHKRMVKLVIEQTQRLIAESLQNFHQKGFWAASENTCPRTTINPANTTVITIR